MGRQHLFIKLSEIGLRVKYSPKQSLYFSLHLARYLSSDGRDETLSDLLRLFYSNDEVLRSDVEKNNGAKRWLESMMKHSKCTYRQSKGRRPGGKRVIFKVEMHCQHKRKPLTPRQIEQKASVSAGNSNKWLMHGLRQKKMDCCSVLKLTVSIPTKKDQRASLDHPYYLVSHPSILQITFTHNHPIESAHSLSFRPIDLETKECFFKLFRMGHCASSAYHWNVTKLFLDGGDDQLLLAERATNPTKSDVSRLYDEWRKKELGPDNGKKLFDKLEMEIPSYNEANLENGGQAKLQVYQNESVPFYDSDSESEVLKKNTKQKEKKIPAHGNSHLYSTYV